MLLQNANFKAKVFFLLLMQIRYRKDESFKNNKINFVIWKLSWRIIKNWLFELLFQPLVITFSSKPPVLDAPTTQPAWSLSPWRAPVEHAWDSGTTCTAHISIPSMSTPSLLASWELQSGATQVWGGLTRMSNLRILSQLLVSKEW